MRKRLGWQDRVSPLVQSILANVVGPDFIATHMTWGAINEWCTHAGYSRLTAVENHPMLTEILRRIAQQETRHIAFYNSQGRDRLDGNRRAQRITRFALRRSLHLVERELQRHSIR